MPEYNYCPRCGSRLPPQSTFCPNCGLRLGSEIPPYEERAQQNGLMGLLNALGAVGALVLAVLLTVNIVLSFAIAPDVIANIGEIGYYVFLIVPFILELFVVYGYGAVIIYLAVMAILVASWVLLLKNSRTLGRELAGEVDKKPSAAFSVATLFAAVLLVNYIVIFILEQTGNTAAAPVSSGVPVWYMLFSFLNASVYEELISRCLLIGVPLMVLTLLGAKEGKWWRPIVGGTGMGKAEKCLILFSATFFALGHLESWDAWKLLPTFAAGLAMGYLFVEYGLYASVMFHFSFNFLSAPIYFTESLAVTFLFGMLMLGFMVLGVPFLLLYTKMALEGVMGKSIQIKKETISEIREDPYPLPVAVCPQCGFRGAIYEDGYLICPQCGKRY
ncbi:MAG: hypothetical protein PWQ88_1054 [Candidatus Methanomethylophilaceae archaeon]|nr:hypothetical protein [Candidatus Methanomethylophilaceae archaeon]